MPGDADKRLREEFQPAVKSLVNRLWKASKYVQKTTFLENFHAVLTKSTYYTFIHNRREVQKGTATLALIALGYDERDVPSMLEPADGKSAVCATVCGTDAELAGGSVSVPDIDARSQEQNAVHTVPAAPDISALPRQQLPVPLTELIGREQAIADVEGRLARSRLVTLVGAGGVGKTRLAIAAAERVQLQFQDGVWFVKLAGLAPLNPFATAAAPTTSVPPTNVKPMEAFFDPVAMAVANALNEREQPGKDLMETLAGRIACRSMLLVVDNCEHLLGACAELIMGLLSRCPRLRILATSRQDIGLFGECVYRVPSLEVPRECGAVNFDADRNTDSRLMEYAAVRLFVERATSRRGLQHESPLVPSTVADICRQLDGIPLAIEMAAARTRTMPVPLIHARLAEQFELLRGEKTSLPRQQTLRSLIDWSYGLLDKSEKALLHRLSVFAGGWTLEGAEHVSCLFDPRADVLDMLTSLADKSLVVYEEREEAARYRLLETVRLYAAEALAAGGEWEAGRDGHLAYFLALAEEAEQKSSGAGAGDMAAPDGRGLREPARCDGLEPDRSPALAESQAVRRASASLGNDRAPFGGP